MRTFSPKQGHFQETRTNGSNQGFQGIQGHLGPLKYHPLTSCQKLEKSLEPFSGNMGITLLLGPFWVI